MRSNVDSRRRAAERQLLARLLQALALILIVGTAARAHAAKLLDVSVLDRDYLVVHLSDGDVTHEGPGETVTRYTPELDTSAAVETGSYTLTSTGDASYAGAGQHPVACSRKTKLNGHAQLEWVSSDFRYESTYEHWIYLRLPSSLQQGRTYTLSIAAATNSDRTTASVTFDVFSSRSEAVHVNLVGYVPAAAHKAADLYHFMGDGGARDYASFVGNTVYLYDVGTGESVAVGQVALWKTSAGDVFGYNLTRSSVWSADFGSFTGTGTYRLVIEGVGCSQDFTLGPAVYGDPFKVSVRGFFYMRLGQDNAASLQPPPRTPLYLPGASPANTTAYLTEMQPWHAQWTSFSGGDVWDNPNAWAAFRKPGNPTNADAWGGHADAADLDRHLGHISIIYDLLLPYLLTDGAISDDDAGIAESGNGIPDVLDEARYEVDFWLRLRDGAGYSHGLTNPNTSNELFQAGPTAIAAWANAANCAMLADAFRVGGHASLRDQYRDAAAAAYAYANGLANPMLDATQGIGDGDIRGRDLKMMAAAFLYNLTGDEAYEAVVNAESVCASGVAALDDGDRNQVWASAAYLLTPQPVHYAALQNNLRAAVIAQAKASETNHIDARPSRRATDERTGYFRTAQNVDRTLIAHAVTTDPVEKALFYKALLLEADWGLGRNPLNMIEMTTAFTPLATKRSCAYIYTSGREDGVPGMHPGHTPYLNLDDWAPGMTMGTPSRLYENGYPADFKNTWPIAEGYFSSPWVWAHSEFTPQQTMRGKTALYGYLYGLSHPGTVTSCTDELRNGTETAVDCGGATCDPCGDGATCTVAADCASGVCEGGICGCSGGLTRCAGACVDTDTSATHCGACGSACPSGQSCTAGDCACDGGLERCSGTCTDTQSSGANCGGCGVACPADQVCSAGACADGCPAGVVQCGQDCVDTASSLVHCGACDVACALPSAVAACTAGTCAIAACQPGAQDLDGVAANGCEYTCTPGGVEVCNALDDDCDGDVNEGLVCGGVGAGGVDGTGAAPGSSGTGTGATAGVGGSPVVSSATDKSGCGCSLPRRGSPYAGLALVLGLLALARYRRTAGARPHRLRS